jgi:amino-acid N-acetyltransferase
MPNLAEKPLPALEAFDEKQFYLDEFRNRTLLFSILIEELQRDDDYGCLAAVVRELLTNDTRVIVLVGMPDPGHSDQVLRRLQRRLGPLIFREETAPLFPQRGARTSAFTPLQPDAFASPETATALLSNIWTTVRRGPLFVGVLAGADRAQTTGFARQVATRLRVHKLILIEPEGGVIGADGKQLSFMDEAMLATLLGAGQAEWAGLAARRATFEDVRAGLLDGVASINLCSLPGVPRELFTYEGSGTLFTRADYCTVQRLGIDDFEEVERLIERGQREGLLKLRSADEVASMLVNGYGATIGQHHLAGICALASEPYRDERAGEIVGLYTITRFKGEGVGGRLVTRVLADARAAGLVYVFACTTEERAQVFFERQGFRRVEPGDVPAAKWASYDLQRKAQISVFRMDLRSSAK